MGLVHWVRRIENRFFDRLEADKSLQKKLALVTWILFLGGSLVSLFLGAATGNWLHLLLGGVLLVATGFAIRNWRRLRSTSESARR